MRTLSPTHSVFRRLAVIALAAGPLTAQAEQPRDQAGFFGLDKSWDIRLTISADTLAAMYPEGRTRMALSQRGRFKYGKGSIEICGQRFDEVGLRFKGNSTFWSTAGTLKRSYKVDFDRFKRGQAFLGLTKLNLQNNATDPTQIREAVSYRVYRDSGVPASRTAFARVFLTVEGEFENQYVGNYTVVEQVDRRFLAHNFGAKAGLIVKPEGRVMPFLGDVWHEDYDATYIPKTPVKSAQAQQLIGMARLVSRGDQDQLSADIERFLDVDEFLRYSAVTLFLANLDSPFMLAHNFYMAVPAKNNRVLWIPWDLNLSIGGFIMAGSDQTNLSVFRAARLPLFDQLLALPRYKKLYSAHLRKLAEGPGSAKSLLANLDLARQTTAAAIEQEAQRSARITKVEGDQSGSSFGRGFERMFRTAGPDAFAKGRAAAVLAQLDGSSEGRSTGGGLFGGGGRGFGGFGRTNQAASTPRESLRRTLRRSRVVEAGADGIDSAQFTAAVTRLFAAIDTDKSGTIKRAELAAIMRSQRGDDFKPSEARSLLRDGDKNRDRSLSKTEWDAAFELAFATWDTDQDGRLSAAELNK